MVSEWLRPHIALPEIPVMTSDGSEAPVTPAPRASRHLWPQLPPALQCIQTHAHAQAHITENIKDKFKKETFSFFGTFIISGVNHGLILGLNFLYI